MVAGVKGVRLLRPASYTGKMFAYIGFRAPHIAAVGVTLLLLGVDARGAPDASPRDEFKLAQGFKIAEFAGPELAPDVHGMTLDDRGRVWVSGRGYLKVLVDEDRDGRADRAITFADWPKDGATGFLVEGPDIFVVGDGGLWHLVDRDGDDRPDGPPRRLLGLKTESEHGAHAIRRGPDGCLYLLCGNSSGKPARERLSPTSPIREPVAGCLLRLKAGHDAVEVVADGFRNPLAMDWNQDGDLFTYDSDNERCVSLPWYEGTRVYHVREGAHHGWENPERGSTWRMPPYFMDVSQPVIDLGRGSPTGVLWQPSRVLGKGGPAGCLLVCDWTFGRIQCVELAADGASYRGKGSVFLEAIGTSGFAPTALAGSLDRTLYVSTGGRGSRGAVYRLERVPSGSDSASPRAAPRDHAISDLNANRAKPDSPAQRRRALESFARDSNAVAMERAIRANWNDPDRAIRQAVARLIRRLPAESQDALFSSAQTPNQLLVVGLALATVRPEDVQTRIAEWLTQHPVRSADQSDAVRVLQIAVGDVPNRAAGGRVHEGYSRGHAIPIRPAVAGVIDALFPTRAADIDRELGRLAAMIELESLSFLDRVLAKIDLRSETPEDIHYLIVASRLRAAWNDSAVDRAAAALVDLDSKLTVARRNRDRNWPDRIKELTTDLAGRIDITGEHSKAPGRFAKALLARPDFGRADHVVFANVPGMDRKLLAERFLARSATDPDFVWSPPLIRLLEKLPRAETRPILRQQWEQVALRPAILAILAHDPDPVDTTRFAEGLELDSATAALALGALEQLPPTSEPRCWLSGIRALEMLPATEETAPMRRRIGAWLERSSGQRGMGDDRDRWLGWFRKTHPDLAGSAAPVSWDDWQRRLGRIDWSRGDARRGRIVATRAGCLGCHNGASALGPDLAGASRRFAREDLFRAIVEPSRDVPDRYRLHVIATTGGKVFQGLVVYEAVDSLLVQMGADQTARIPMDQVTARRIVATSPMPAGLLDRSSDADIADLAAFLGMATTTSQPAAREAAAATNGTAPRAARTKP